jgi:hypothetical protein
MGKLQGIQLGLSLGNDGCGACGMKKQGASGCCKDVVTVSKISDAHKQANTHAFPAVRMASKPVTYVVEYAPQAYLDGIVLPKESRPPPLEGVDWQSFHGQFRC